MKDNQMKQAEREAFETAFPIPDFIKWDDKGFGGYVAIKGAGTYVEAMIIAVNKSWDGWQARAKLTKSQVSEPEGYRLRVFYPADDIEGTPAHWGKWSYTEDKPIPHKMWTYEIEPFYLAPTTPQEAISPAIAQAMKDAGRYKCLVSMATKDFERAAQYQFVGKLHEFVDDIKPSVDEALASKPTGLE